MIQPLRYWIQQTYWLGIPQLLGQPSGVVKDAELGRSGFITACPKLECLKMISRVGHTVLQPLRRRGRDALISRMKIIFSNSPSIYYEKVSSSHLGCTSFNRRGLSCQIRSLVKGSIINTHRAMLTVVIIWSSLKKRMQMERRRFLPYCKLKSNDMVLDRLRKSDTMNVSPCPSSRGNNWRVLWLESQID